MPFRDRRAVVAGGIVDDDRRHAGDAKGVEARRQRMGAVEGHDNGDRLLQQLFSPPGTATAQPLAKRYAVLPPRPGKAIVAPIRDQERA